MARKFSLFPLLAVIAVAAALALWSAPQGPQPAQAAVIPVCDPGGDFSAIQAAIDSGTTIAGDIIEICQGTYTADGTPALLTIDKGVTIRNLAGDDVTLVRSSGGGFVVDITAPDASLVNSGSIFTVRNDGTAANDGVINVAAAADDVTIDGMTLRQASADPAANTLLQMDLGAGSDGMTFINNEVFGPVGSNIDFGETLDFVRDTTGAPGFVIDNNTLHGAGIAYQGPGSMAAPSFITNNIIDSNGGARAAGQVIQVGQGGATTAWVEVTGNTITGVAGNPSGTNISGILLGGQSNGAGTVDHVIIRTNTVDGVVCDAIEVNQFGDPAAELTFSNITIEDNTLTDNGCSGIFVNSDLDGSTGNGSIAATAFTVVECNDITGNTLFGYEDGDNGTFIAQNNWWGNVGGPGVGGANDNTSNVEDDPFLTETFVTAAQCQTPPTPPAGTILVCRPPFDFSEIQMAIDGASAGNIIEICQGTYTEDAVLTISEDVTVTNRAGDDVTLVRPDGGADGVVVDITADGASLLGINTGGSFTVKNDDTTSGNGVINVALGTDNVTIDGVTLRNACSSASCLNILQMQGATGSAGDGMTFTNNEVFGPPGADAEFGETLDFVRGSSGTGTGFLIDNNTLHGAGIAYQGPGTMADPSLITNNTVDSDSGTRAAGQVIQVGQGAVTTSWVQVTGNTITGSGGGTSIFGMLLGGQAGGTGSVSDVTIQSNAVTDTTCDAIEINQFGDPADQLTFSDITIQFNTLADNACSGIFTNSDLDGGTANESIVAADLLVECNDITGNTLFGFEDGDDGVFTAENNWWGNVGGPGVGGANDNTGNVDDLPFLTESFTTAPECPSSQFLVNKDFSDANPANVTVALNCSTGSVVNDDTTASEADDANFTVNNFTVGATCTATETGVPAGYTKDESLCLNVPISTGSCTLVNTLNTVTFEVNKDFSDDNTASVTVGLSCSTGTVVVNDPTASEADDADFTVNGFTVGATCTATETVPAGYTANQTACAGVAITPGGTASCTIVNTLNPAKPAVGRGNAWHLRNSNTAGAADNSFPYGKSGDTKLMCDWDGDGVRTPGVVRGNIWHLRNSNTGGVADISFPYGIASDTKVCGDWNGNGTDTPGVVRGNIWHLRNTNTGGVADISFPYGIASDTKLACDWNGNGTDTPSVVRGFSWHLRNSNTGGVADISFPYGQSGDTKVCGDWNGNGTDTPGVVRGSTWHLRNSNTGGVADISFPYGIASDTPLVWR